MPAAYELIHIKKWMFVCQCKKAPKRLNPNATGGGGTTCMRGSAIDSKIKVRIEINIQVTEFRPKRRAAHGDMSRSMGRGIEVY